MFTIVKWFFLVLGMITFVGMVTGSYLWMTDTYKIRTIGTALFDAGQSMVTQVLTPPENQSEEEVGMVENEGSVGSNDEADISVQTDTTSASRVPAGFPTELSVEQWQCMDDKLGSERVAEIVDGDAPTPLEIARGLACL